MNPAFDRIIAASDEGLRRLASVHHIGRHGEAEAAGPLV